MWIKVLGIIFFGVFAIAFSSDLYVIDYTYNSTGRGIEHGIDAGIIRSGIVVDAQQGIVQLEESSLKDATKSEFMRYMKMDMNLENAIMKNSEFDLNLTYDAEGVPWVQVEFHTRVSFSIPFIDYPVTVNRKIAYESIYK